MGGKSGAFFPPGQPPSRAESFRITASWFTSSGALERLQLQLRDSTLSSPVASPIWPESLPKKREKTAQTPRLPGAISLSSELRFVRTLYHWKVDFPSFPTVFCITHFEQQKAPKTASKNRVRKLYRCKNRERFVGGATWQIRSPRGARVTQHDVVRRNMMLRESHYIKNPLPLLCKEVGSGSHLDFGLFWADTRERGLLLGFRVVCLVRVKSFYLGNPSLPL